MAVPLLDVVSVAEAIIDGVRRDKEYIYIPYMGVKFALSKLASPKMHSQKCIIQFSGF